MNPPFGDPPAVALETIEESFAASGRDLGACFVSESVNHWARAGCTGALLSTALWFRPAYTEWREDVLLGGHSYLHLCMHLGGQVLDGATVSASPIVLHGSKSSSIVFRLVRSDSHVSDLEEQLDFIAEGHANDRLFCIDVNDVCFLNP